MPVLPTKAHNQSEPRSELASRASGSETPGSPEHTVDDSLQGTLALPRNSPIHSPTRESFHCTPLRLTSNHSAHRLHVQRRNG